MLASCNKDPDLSNENSNITPDQNDSFTVTLSMAGDQTGKDLLATQDGHYLTLGISSNPFGDDIILAKWTLLGEPVWDYSYSKLIDDAACSMIECPNGDVVIAATTSDTADHDIWLLRVNTDGILISENQFGDGNMETLSGIIEDPNGGFYITGFAEGSTTLSRDVLLAKVDDNLNLQWTKYYGGINQDGAMDIGIRNGNVLLLCFTYSYGAGDKDFWLIETNAAGDSLWSSTFGSPNYEDPQAMLIEPDGTVMLFGHSAAQDPAHDMYALQLDQSLSMMWQQYYGAASYHDGGEDIALQTNGYVATGRTNFGDHGGEDIAIFAIGPASHETYIGNFGTTGDDYPNAIIDHFDAAIVCGTWHSGAGNDDLVLIRAPFPH